MASTPLRFRREPPLPEILSDPTPAAVEPKLASARAVQKQCILSIGRLHEGMAKIPAKAPSDDYRRRACAQLLQTAEQRKRAAVLDVALFECMQETAHLRALIRELWDTMRRSRGLRFCDDDWEHEKGAFIHVKATCEVCLGKAGVEECTEQDLVSCGDADVNYESEETLVDSAQLGTGFTGERLRLPPKKQTWPTRIQSLNWKREAPPLPVEDLLPRIPTPRDLGCLIKSGSATSTETSLLSERRPILVRESMKGMLVRWAKNPTESDVDHEDQSAAVSDAEVSYPPRSKWLEERPRVLAQRWAKRKGAQQQGG